MEETTTKGRMGKKTISLQERKKESNKRKMHTVEEKKVHIHTYNIYNIN